MFSRLACSLVSGWLLFAPPAGPGLRYHAQVELPAALSVNVWVEGDRARLEIESSDEPSLAAGTAMLTSDRGENLVVLDPAKQEFFPLSHELIAGFKQRAADRLHITCGPISSETLAEDPGAVLAGYATRHLRFHIRLTAHQAAPSGEITSEIDVFEHIWLTEELRQRNIGLTLLSDSSGTGFPVLDEYLRKQLGELPGFVLKRNLVMTVDDSHHNRQVLRTAYEITQLTGADAPDSLFEVPGNFHTRVPQHGGPATATPSHPYF